MQDEKVITGQILSPEQVANVSGGEAASCPTSITIGPITTNAATVGDALMQIYNGFVDVTTQVIERVVQATKPQ